MLSEVSIAIRADIFIESCMVPPEAAAAVASEGRRARVMRHMIVAMWVTAAYAQFDKTLQLSPPDYKQSTTLALLIFQTKPNFFVRKFKMYSMNLTPLSDIDIIAKSVQEDFKHRNLYKVIRK